MNEESQGYWVILASLLVAAVLAVLPLWRSLDDHHLGTEMVQRPNRRFAGYAQTGNTGDATGQTGTQVIQTACSTKAHSKAPETHSA